MPGESTFKVGYHLVSQANIGECPAHHDLVVSPPRTVGIEVRGFDPVLLQIFSRRAVFLDGSRWGNVVGSNAVSQHRQHTRMADIANRTGLQHHAIEVRGSLNVRRSGVPGVRLARRHVQRPPAVVAFVNLAITFTEHV